MSLARVPGGVRRLNKKARIESVQGAVPDGAGGTTGGAWARVADVWCRVEPIPFPLRRDEEHKEREAVTHTVTIRQRRGVTRGVRFRVPVHGDRILIPVGPGTDPDESGRFLSFRCQELYDQ